MKMEELRTDMDTLTVDPEWQSTLEDWPLTARERRDYLRAVVDMGR
jgi:hypothetical protein